MGYELMMPTQILLRDIADPKMSRADVAATYRLALQSKESTDWKKVNQAIVDRWSFSSLEYIKKLAWDKP